MTDEHSTNKPVLVFGPSLGPTGSESIKIMEDLGINFLPARQTVIDHFGQMLDQGMV